MAEDEFPETADPFGSPGQNAQETVGLLNQLRRQHRVDPGALVAAEDFAVPFDLKSGRMHGEQPLTAGATGITGQGHSRGVNERAVSRGVLEQRFPILRDRT